ncbi:hypothetical protein CHS0354_002133 [Potamilus streckersoni]|uniref:PPM-type phosphatase domain-containing protein n=1 Tax=Potamilus streckersoni TaxID=2493646 RepID=A0AAE0TFR1_9BIVA|nr:hypothetical protein CHS0354_002133 [Potamilus streckersoni]
MNIIKNILFTKIFQRLLKQSCPQSTRHLCCSHAQILPQAPGTANEMCTVRYRPVKLSTVSYSSVLSDPENKGSHQKGVNFDTLGSWNNRLDMPILVDKSIEKGKLIPRIPLEDVGTASLIGRRKINEDRWIVKQLTPDILYFGIFDGHGGPDVVDYACQHMEDHLCFELTQTDNLSKVLYRSFVNLNNVIARHLAYYNTAQDLNMMGTTATICLLRNSIELVVGNVGDSRAVLSREGQAIRLSHDHEAQDTNEATRIKKYGGTVVENSLGTLLVNGRLNMTRSLGDVELKMFGVTAHPNIRSIEVKHGKDSFLVLMTDGLSYVLNDQEICDIIISSAIPSEAATLVTDEALQFGSEDNVTAVIIPFGAWGKYRSTTRTIPYSFGRNFFSTRY